MSALAKLNKVYPKGYVYMLSSSGSDNVYVGSTTRELNQRLAEHRYEYFKMRGNLRSRVIFEDAPDPNAVYITILEVVPRCTKLQLRAREQYHISTNPDAINHAHAMTFAMPHINNNDPINEIYTLFIEA